ncbi:WG repeat-containing protein, partial [Marinigracilibium pacificum]
KKKGDKIGFVDKDMNTVIPFEYDYVTAFTEERAYVEIADKKFIINTKNERLLDVSQYFGVRIDNQSAGIVAVETEEGTHFGAINLINGEITFSIGNHVIQEFKNGLAPINLGYDENGEPSAAVINTQGDFVIPQGKYNSIWHVGNLITAADYEKNIEDVYDLDGNFIFSTKYGIGTFDYTKSNNIYRFSDIESSPRMYGSIDEKGNIITPLKYHNIDDNGWSKDGLILVHLNDQIFYIDLNGREYRKQESENTQASNLALEQTF